MDVITKKLTEGKPYDESGDIYRKPLAKFLKFGTSGVRWLVPGYLERLKKDARSKAKYDYIT